jgi:hypothetical protein
MTALRLISLPVHAAALAALGAVAVILAATGDRAASLYFTAAMAVQLALDLTMRHSARA